MTQWGERRESKQELTWMGRKKVSRDGERCLRVRTSEDGRDPFTGIDRAVFPLSSNV